MSKTENKTAIAALIDKLKAANVASVVDRKGVVSKEAYVSTLPESITEEKIKELQNHNSLFYPAITKVCGEASIEAMKADPSLESVSWEIPLVDRDHFDITIQRTRTFPNPKATGENSEPIVKWGTVQAQLVTQAARANRGEMSSVRDELAALALASLGS